MIVSSIKTKVNPNVNYSVGKSVDLTGLLISKIFRVGPRRSLLKREQKMETRDRKSFRNMFTAPLSTCRRATVRLFSKFFGRLNLHIVAP